MWMIYTSDRLKSSGVYNIAVTSSEVSDCNQRNTLSYTTLLLLVIKLGNQLKYQLLHNMDVLNNQHG